MYDEFIKKLESDEKLLYYGKASVEKVAKQVIRKIFVSLILICFWIVFFNFLKYNLNIEFNTTVIFIVLLVLSISIAYGILYDIFLKFKNKNNEYFVTNKSITLYNTKKGWISRKISDIERIGITNEKGNYANLTFVFYGENLTDMIKGTVSFEGVESPREILERIRTINSNIIVYDDRPTVMGRKV